MINKGKAKFTKLISRHIYSIDVFFVFALVIYGCNDPIKVKTSQKYEPLLSDQYGEYVVIAPIVLNCESDQRNKRNGLLNQPKGVPSQIEQDNIKDKILNSFSQILEKRGFIIPNTNQDIDKLLEEISRQHTTLISQYKPKDSFQGLLSNISEQSNADGVILIDVLVTYGSSGYIDPIFSGSSSENTNATSFKIAYICTKDAKLKWFSEIYMRDTIQEFDVDKILKKIMKNK